MPIARTSHGRTPSRAYLGGRSEEHTSELQSQSNLVCRLLLEKKKTASCVVSLGFGRSSSRTRHAPFITARRSGAFGYSGLPTEDNSVANRVSAFLKFRSCCEL